MHTHTLTIIQLQLKYTLNTYKDVSLCQTLQSTYSSPSTYRHLSIRDYKHRVRAIIDKCLHVRRGSWQRARLHFEWVTIIQEQRAKTRQTSFT